MRTARSSPARLASQALAASFVALWCCSASAQTTVRSFDRIGTVICAGDTVRVTDTAGRDVRGRVAAVGPASLVLDVRGARRELGKDDIDRVRQYYRDAGWDGAAVGAAAGAGALLGLAYAGDREMATDPEARPALIVMGAGGGALIGFIIDKLHRGQRMVYIRPPTARVRPGLSVTPAIAPRIRAVTLTLSF